MGSLQYFGRIKSDARVWLLSFSILLKLGISRAPGHCLARLSVPFGKLKH